VPALSGQLVRTGKNERNVAMTTYTQRWNGATPPAVISGSQLAHKRFSKRERAQIAGALMDDRAQLGRLNQRQIADLCKVSLAYARRMRRPQSAPQLQQAAE
jgi:hypothetical protein